MWLSKRCHDSVRFLTQVLPSFVLAFCRNPQTIRTSTRRIALKLCSKQQQKTAEILLLHPFSANYLCKNEQTSMHPAAARTLSLWSAIQTCASRFEFWLRMQLSRGAFRSLPRNSFCFRKRHLNSKFVVVFFCCARQNLKPLFWVEAMDRNGSIFKLSDVSFILRSKLTCFTPFWRWKEKQTIVVEWWEFSFFARPINGHSDAEFIKPWGKCETLEQQRNTTWAAHVSCQETIINRIIARNFGVE